MGPRCSTSAQCSLLRESLCPHEPHCPCSLLLVRLQVEAGAQVIDINFDEGLLDSVAAMTRFVNLLVSEPEVRERLMLLLLLCLLLSASTFSSSSLFAAWSPVASLTGQLVFLPVPTISSMGRTRGCLVCS